MLSMKFPHLFLRPEIIITFLWGWEGSGGQVQHRSPWNSGLAHLYECTGRAIALPPASAMSVGTKCLSFTLKFLKVMGKVLSGERSCTQTGLVF